MADYAKLAIRRAKGNKRFELTESLLKVLVLATHIQILKMQIIRFLKQVLIQSK